ncbi:MAG: SGNH/GDSL hydrolase family protein [Planctomycetes bacterium]|nr:SGNH/GDSL hydrolase family protein [Planctomycetota bacterium]
MKIYVIGDSISIQYGPFLEKYLEGFMEYSRKEGTEEALLNLDNPQGANGGDSSMVLRFLRSMAEKDGNDADYMLVNCGLHDLKTDPASGARQIEIEDYEKNLREIVSVVGGMKPKMIWMRITPCDEAVHNVNNKSFHRYQADCARYNAAADKVMRELGVPSIDLFTFTSNLGDNPYCDHVHFKEEVREKQAAFIAGYLAGLL